MDPSTADGAARPVAPQSPPARQASLVLTPLSERRSYYPGRGLVKTRPRPEPDPEPVPDETPLTLADVLLWPEWTAKDVKGLNYEAFDEDGYPILEGE